MSCQHYSDVESAFAVIAVVGYLVEPDVDIVVVSVGFLVEPDVDVAVVSAVVFVVIAGTGAIIAGLKLGNRLAFVYVLGMAF